MNRQTPLIKLWKAGKTYRRGKEVIHALDGVDLTVERGEMLAVVGPSGSGKTTLMNVLGCIDRLTQGTLAIDGKQVSGRKEKDLVELRRETIGFVFQQFFLIPTLTASENVAVPGLFSGLGNREKRAVELLKTVGMGKRQDHFPTQLSGGEMQRVAIARSLVNSPKILLADEPTGNLDSDNTDQIFALFRELNKNGLTIIIVTHNMKLARGTDRIFSIRDGKVRSC